jgi:ribonuclease HI
MKYIIFTDGSSRGNPGKGGWGAIVATGDNQVKSQKSKVESVREIGGREDDTTNNRMEMTAVIEALKTVQDDAPIKIFTDSAYLINGITKWVWAWQKNNWQTKTKDDVLNVDLWQELVKVSAGKKIEWNRISGHSGVPANERCDVIATTYADGSPVSLFHGLKSEYNIDLSVTVGTEKAIKSKSNKKAVAYSYVSKVDGVIKTHKTWAECEARVKGVSGARFKKAISKEDEENIIEEFSD